MSDNDDRIQARIERIAKELTVGSIEERRIQIEEIVDNLSLKGFYVDEEMKAVFDQYINGEINVTDLAEYLGDKM